MLGTPASPVRPVRRPHRHVGPLLSRRHWPWLQSMAPGTPDVHAVGDAAEPVRLHQGEVQILITLGSSSAADGWGGYKGPTDRDIIHFTQGPGYNDSENHYIYKSGV